MTSFNNNKITCGMMKTIKVTSNILLSDRKLFDTDVLMILFIQFPFKCVYEQNVRHLYLLQLC